MVGDLALHQPLHLWPQAGQFNQQAEKPPGQEPPRTLSLNHVENMEDFQKAHAQFIKLSLDRRGDQARGLLLACAIREWGSLDYARAVFWEIDDPDTFHFNIMIRAHVDHCEPDSALLFYQEMMEQEVRSNKYTFPFVLKACALLRDLRRGMQLHGHVVKLGLASDVFIQNSVINLYGKCLEVELSSKAFEHMGSSRTAASWSALLAAYSGVKRWSDCLRVFVAMTREKLRPDESSMVTALSSCSNLGLLDHGRSLHCFLLRNFNMLNTIVDTSLVDMYIKCGQPEKGMLIFDKMPNRNIWTYGAMISGLAFHGLGKGTFQLFYEMLKQGIQPDETICIGLLTACREAGMVAEALSFFDQMMSKYHIPPKVQHYSCMVDILGHAGRLTEAYDLILSMPTPPTPAVWRSLLGACKLNGDVQMAELAYTNLQQMNALNAGDCINLSNMLCKLQRWEEAAEIRKEIANRGLLQKPALSQVHVRGRTHFFASQERSDPGCKRCCIRWNGSSDLKGMKRTPRRWRSR
ncbi:hypothetical protein HPP92_020420 [Vanilla planifolia]|uniref:Pentatricopeptide repeat-containing protein n=1 Tax=Vanilla planifolia TaxID=51239 RepID=A0A835PY22_VANPL|nr:hypothetical protein HPP92_020420 [Vanilla planifolia]